MIWLLVFGCVIAYLLIGIPSAGVGYALFTEEKSRREKVPPEWIAAIFAWPVIWVIVIIGSVGLLLWEAAKGLRWAANLMNLSWVIDSISAVSRFCLNHSWFPAERAQPPTAREDLPVAPITPNGALVDQFISEIHLRNAHKTENRQR